MLTYYGYCQSSHSKMFRNYHFPTLIMMFFRYWGADPAQVWHGGAIIIWWTRVSWQTPNIKWPINSSSPISRGKISTQSSRVKLQITTCLCRFQHLSSWTLHVRPRNFILAFSNDHLNEYYFVNTNLMALERMPERKGRELNAPVFQVRASNCINSMFIHLFEWILH